MSDFKCEKMKKIISILLIAACSMAVMAQKEISIDEYDKQVNSLYAKSVEEYKKKDYQAAEKSLNDAIALFDQLSKENQKDCKDAQATLYYQLSCCLSLHNKKKAAIDAFEKAVNTYGFSNYAHTKVDTDLDNIRSDKRFIALMQSIREKYDYIYIFQSSGKYQRADTTGLPHFTYETATSNNLKNVRKFFKLDSIAGQGDETSKIINLLNWVHNNIRHDGNNTPICELDAIDIYNYYKSTGKGVSCRNLAFVLNEMYLSMGFRSRYVTCLPKNENDEDCHVINCVYSTTLKKWLWMDPTNNAYVKDENGNLLSIEEVRERLIDGRPLVLNEDANWNNEVKKTKENYLDSYMAKNLYWLQCPVDSRFNAESRYRNTQQTYVALRPSDDERPAPNNIKELMTHDAVYFWQTPE